MLGAYLNASDGRVHAAFEPGRNLRASALDPSQPLLWALDFNVDPMSSVIAHCQGERLHVLAEIVLHRASTA